MLPTVVEIYVERSEFSTAGCDFSRRVDYTRLETTSSSLLVKVMAQYFSAVGALSLIGILDCAHVCCAFYITCTWDLTAQIGS